MYGWTDERKDTKESSLSLSSSPLGCVGHTHIHPRFLVFLFVLCAMCFETVFFFFLCMRTDAPAGEIAGNSGHLFSQG